MDIDRELATQRLLLRKPRLDDAQSIFDQYAQDMGVVRYLSWTPHNSITDTEAFLADCIDEWQYGKNIAWIIERKSDAQLLGMIDLRTNDHGAHFGYVLAKAYWGQGIMTEALIVVRDLALKQPKIFRFWAICDVDNKASARVMEKAGMIKEGCLQRYFIHPNVSSEPRDCYCYAIAK